jgi:hypothetical protein
VPGNAPSPAHTLLIFRKFEGIGGQAINFNRAHFTGLFHDLAFAGVKKGVKCRQVFPLAPQKSLGCVIQPAR